MGAQRDEAAGRQRALEADLASLEARRAGIEVRLYSGSVTVPRELQAMQAEAESLRRRRGGLEDAVLEAMAEREPLDDELAALEGRGAALAAEGSRLRAAVAEAQAAIDHELESQAAARAAAVDGLPADLTSLYERLRARLGGVAAAPLANGRCGGCHLALPATELDRLRREPADALVTCEQCGRILVRP